MNLFSRILNIYWQISHILAGVLATLYPYTKRDDQCKVENYSGITLLSAFCKLLTSILNNRLYSYMIEKGSEQGGFRKMYVTVDYIFILITIIDK